MDGFTNSRSAARLMSIRCPQCSLNVYPAPDGACPACGFDTGQAMLRERDEGSVSHDQAAHARLAALNDWTDEQDQSTAISPAHEAALRFELALRALTPRVWVTPTLVVVNIALFLGLVVSARTPFPGFDDLIAWGADFGPRTMAGEWWRLITSAFLHLNPLHLAFNMWALWNVGRLVERMAGNIGFVLLYAVSAIGGNIASLAWHPHVVSGGASGAIFGICGALIAYVFTRKDTVPAEILSQLKSSMGGFLVYNIAFGFMVPGIDNAAHLGGLTSGFLFGLLISQPIAVETVRSRPLRNALAAVVAGGLLFAAAWMLPAAPIDVQAEFPQFSAEHEKLLRHYNDLVRKNELGELDDAALADEIESEILPQWRDLRQQLESWRTAPLVNMNLVNHQAEVMRMREEAWQLLIEGLRKQDDELLEQFYTRWGEANQHAQSPSNAAK